MWVLVGASPTGPTSNGQPGTEDFKAGSTGEKPSAPLEPDEFKACAYHDRGARGTKKIPPW
jgi:hypothetical protein